MDPKDQQAHPEVSPQTQFFGPTNQFNLPVVYSNVVLVGISASADIQLTLTVNGKAFNQIIIPLAAAKSLSIALDKGLSDYEQKTKTKILDLNEVSALLQPK